MIGSNNNEKLVPLLDNALTGDESTNEDDHSGIIHLLLDYNCVQNHLDLVTEAPATQKETKKNELNKELLKSIENIAYQLVC